MGTRGARGEPDDRAQGGLLVTVPQACRLLSLSRSALYELMGRGELAYVQIGRSRLLKVDTLQLFADANTKGGSHGGSRPDQ